MKLMSRGTALSTDERERLVRLIDTETMESLRESSGLSRNALLSAAIGLPVLAGTRRLVRDLLDAYPEGEEHDDDQDEEHDEDHGGDQDDDDLDPDDEQDDEHDADA